MTNIKKFFYQDIKPSHNSFYLWLFCILIFFSILRLSNEPISDFWLIVLLTVFVIGVISFLAIFIKISLLQKPLLLIRALLQRKMNKGIIIIGALIVFLFTLFYWFQIRPSQIKIECQKKADAHYNESLGLNDPDPPIRALKTSIDWANKSAKDLYQSCLHRNGL